MAVLAADVGATNARFALYPDDGPAAGPLAAETLASRDHASLEEAIRKFLSRHAARVRSAALGLPGPVRDGRVRTTNLPWLVEETRLADELGGAAVRMLNDVEAAAHGLGLLGPGDRVDLNPGAVGSCGNRALISVGSGLGVAGLAWIDGDLHPFATEGGHADFAPRDEQECELLSWLRARYGRVSVERVVSGPGLRNVYEFLRDTARIRPTPGTVRRMAEGDPSAVVAEEGEADPEGPCGTALRRFASVLGAEAGNVALRLLATGGVFLAGGVPPRVVPTLRSGVFLDAFLDKGRFRALLEDVPVCVVTNPDLGLLGAGRVAARLAFCDPDRTQERG